MSINWTPHTDGPQGAPVQTQIADVGTMLAAFADRKQRLALEEARRAQEAAQFQAQQAELGAHHRALEDYNNANLEQQNTNARLTREQKDFEENAKAREARDKYASEGVPKVQEAYRAGGEVPAQGEAAAHGIDLRRDFRLNMPPIGKPDAPMEPSANIMRGVLPTGASFELDAAAEEGARKQAGARLAEQWLPEMGKTIESSPFGKEAATYAVNAARTGQVGSKDDLNKMFMERMQHLEDQANTTKRAKISNVPAVSGGGRQADAATVLTDMIESGKDGQPYPTAELQRRATELGFPITGKAGMLTLDGLLKTTTFRQKGADTHHRAGERDAALVITDPDTGDELGQAKNPVEAKAINRKNEKFGQLKTRLESLIEDIDENGDRVLMPGSVQRRNSRMNLVAAAGRVYNGLGATDASQKIEELIASAAGTPGHGFWAGANLGVLKDLLKEAEKSHRQSLRISLREGAAGSPTPEGHEGVTDDLNWAASAGKK